MLGMGLGGRGEGVFFITSRNFFATKTCLFRLVSELGLSPNGEDSGFQMGVKPWS